MRQNALIHNLIFYQFPKRYLYTCVSNTIHMCGRFNQPNINLSKHDKNHLARLNRWKNRPKVNVGIGMLAAIETIDGITEAEFGFHPSWDTSKLFFNARVEGKGNESNSHDGWDVGVDTMNSFKSSFKSKRCIIPVNSFIEGPEKEKLSKPFLISNGNGNEMYLGGIHTTYTNKVGEEENCFAILTTPAVPICKKIGHHRSPFMLYEDLFDMWLNPQTDIGEIKAFIKAGYYDPEMVAYPLSPELVKSGRLHEEEILAPVGEIITV